MAAGGGGGGTTTGAWVSPGFGGVGLGVGVGVGVGVGSAIGTCGSIGHWPCQAHG